MAKEAKFSGERMRPFGWQPTRGIGLGGPAQAFGASGHMRGPSRQRPPDLLTSRVSFSARMPRAVLVSQEDLPRSRRAPATRPAQSSRIGRSGRFAHVEELAADRDRPGCIAACRGSSGQNSAAIGQIIHVQNSRSGVCRCPSR